jgi:hypothetical protein
MAHTPKPTTLDIHGKLKLFSSVADLLAYFCDHRLEKFNEKIEFEKNYLLTQIEQMTDKAKFIKMVVERKIDFRQLNKAQLLDVIGTKITTGEHGKSFINIPLYSCTTDAVESLESKIKQCTHEHIQLTKTNALERYLTVL